MSKHGCDKGKRWSKKAKACMTMCHKPSIRSSKPPYHCYTPKPGKKTGSKPSCSNKKKRYIKAAGKCMKPCRGSRSRRMTKPPYTCYVVTPRKK